MTPVEHLYANTHGFNGSHTHLQPLHRKRPVHKQRTHTCSPAAGERPTPELAAPKRPAKPYVYVQPQMETAAVKKSITVVEESESHTGKHNRGIIRPCCAASGTRTVAARHLMHLRVDGCSSHRETPSAALLRCCCRATHANLDPARTCPIHGRHQWRMARSVANVQRAHSLRARVFAVERSSLRS